MLKRERPVAAFVVMMLLLIAAVLFSLLGVLDYLSERSRQLEQLRSDVQLLSDQLAASLSVPIWNFDEPQINSIANGVMNDQSVSGLIISYSDVTSPNSARYHLRSRGAQWNLIARDTDGPVDLSPDDSISEQRDIIYAANGQTGPGSPIRVGTVKVFESRRFMAEELWRHIRHEIMIFVAAGIVLIASLCYLLWRTVLRPLNVIDRYAQEVSASGGGAKRPIAPEGKRFRGELERVRTSIEKMVELLESRLAETRSRERQFRTFIEQAPVPITLVPSPDGAAVYFNPAFTRIFGYSREDIQRPEDWWPLIYPDPAYRAARRAAWEAKLGKLREGGGFQDSDEAEMHTKSGATRFAQVRLALVEGYRMSFINDLTERRQAETALRLTQYAVDHNPVMNFCIDVEGRFEYANDAACSQLGYTPAEIPTQHIWDIAPTFSAGDWKMRSMSLRDQGSTSFESVYATKSGVTFPVEVRIQYVEFSGQRHFFIYASDITDRKAAQDAEHAYTRRIQKLATELTRAEERQRRELATVLHDEVGQSLFAATTLLLTIRNSVNGCRMEVEKAISLLDQVTRDTRELTFELCPPALYQLGLVPALQRLVDQFKASHGITCTLSGQTTGPSDLNARGLAYQAVRELVNNAAKHSGVKHVTINALETNGDVRISVSDDGKGFDPDHLQPGAGGFGLFHLRERIELLGGEVSIDAAHNRGCRVELKFPASILQYAE